jgi:hypothetical protein
MPSTGKGARCDMGRGPMKEWIVLEERSDWLEAEKESAKFVSRKRVSLELKKIFTASPRVIAFRVEDLEFNALLDWHGNGRAQGHAVFVLGNKTD